MQSDTWTAKDWTKVAMFVKDLYAMVERVCYDNVFVHAQTETMRWVELAQTSAWLTDLAPTVHEHIHIDYLYSALREQNSH